MKTPSIFLSARLIPILCISCVISFVAPSSSPAFNTLHVIQFGGVYGLTYSPDPLSVFVGDTIEWEGDFSQYSLLSTLIPPGAAAFGLIHTGNTFSYVVKIEGSYSYENPTYAPIGMKGSFTALRELYGLSNEGREFFLGMLYPSYNNIAVGQTAGTFKAHALISSYYDNEIALSYYDQSGNEINKTVSKIAAQQSLQISLDVGSMRMDTSVEQASFRSCHITSKYPIAVQYLSEGVNCGGSYLAIPALSLGKNYVVASYNDNPGGGALYDPVFGGYDYPTTFEYAGGQFLIVGTEDGTAVTIIPTTTTTGGHVGVHSGSGASGAIHPYSIELNKGQCYLVRSDGKDADADISGSIVSASKPVAVISGHEDADLGGVDPYTMEGRDFMIEQMTPVEYWDSAGYVSIPLAESSPPGNEGHGDSYRIYTNDSTTVLVQMDVPGISGGYPFQTSRLALPVPEKFDITDPVDIYSTNGHKISVMQYDERSQGLTAPFPAPSMVTVVPRSRWRTSYNFSILFPKDPFGITDNQFINVISDSLNDIKISTDGFPEKNISALINYKSFDVVTSNSTIKGAQYQIGAGSYYIHSSHPFIIYVYGMNQLSPFGSPESDYTTFETESATTAGMQLNTGISPSFAIDTTTTCSGWHVCVRDTGTNDPGLRAVILIDDPDGVYWQTPGVKFTNVTFDSLSADYADGELHPHFHSSQSYCFDINFQSPFAAASAPLAIVDNLGNAVILRLDRSASTLKLSTNPPTSSRSDSIVFPVKQIGEQICTTFVFKNSAALGGTALNLLSALFTNTDTSYKLQSVIPPLPHLLVAQDSLLLQVCYTPGDSSRHRDSLVMKTDCFSIPISLDAHGSTGLIDAGDADFGSITAGTSLCKNLVIKNVGSARFTLRRSFILSDTVNFSCDSSKLPVIIEPDGSIQLQVCFHPKIEGSYSAGIDWTTDLEPSFAHSIKSHSLLTGQATPEAGVRSVAASNSFSIHPNPASGNSIFILLPLQQNEKMSLSIFDVMGQEVYKTEIIPGTLRLAIQTQTFKSGMYYVRLVSGANVYSGKLQLLK